MKVFLPAILLIAALASSCADMSTPEERNAKMAFAVQPTTSARTSTAPRRHRKPHQRTAPRPTTLPQKQSSDHVAPVAPPPDSAPPISSPAIETPTPLPEPMPAPPPPPKPAPQATRITRDATPVTPAWLRKTLRWLKDH